MTFSAITVAVFNQVQNIFSILIIALWNHII